MVHTFNEPINGAVISPDNQKLISHNFPIEQAELWDIKTGKLLFTFPQQNAGWISVIQFLPDNEHALVGNDNNDVALWNLNTLKIEQDFKDSVGAATFHIFSHNGNFFMVTDDYDGRIRVWNVQTGEVQTSFMTHVPYEYGSDSAVSSDGKLVLLGFRKGVSQLWDLETGSLIREYATPILANDVPLDDTYTLVKFSPDNQQILIGYSNEVVHLWVQAG